MARSQRSRTSRRKRRSRGIPKLLGYILSLDWDEETLSFVIHGLWPQFTQRVTPPVTKLKIEDKLTQRTFNRFLAHWINWSKEDIQQFLQHEWKVHGTVSKMSPNEYFKKTLEVYRAALNKALQDTSFGLKKNLRKIKTIGDVRAAVETCLEIVPHVKINDGRLEQIWLYLDPKYIYVDSWKKPAKLNKCIVLR